VAILLSNVYRINHIDTRNYIIEKKRISKKSNQEYWENVGGYYPNIDLTCKALKDIIITDSVDECTNVYDLIELLAAIQEHYRKIDIVGEEKNGN
jgi:deoxyadenosine/deoxycytidine kinase